MALLTIAESVKHYNNPLVSGVAATIVDQDPLLGALPWQAIAGDTLRYTWETGMGGAGFLDVNATIPDALKNASSVENKFVTLKTAVAQAEVDRFVAKAAEAAGRDPMVYEIASKAKNLSRQYSASVANAATLDGSAFTPSLNTFDSQIHTECTTAVNAVFDLDMLDDLLNLLKGGADFISMSRADITKYKQAMRALGGVTEQVLVRDPFTGAERSVLAYEGIPVFINDFIAKGDNTVGSTIYAGRFDDGSQKTGVSMLHLAGTPAGMEIEDLGVMENKVASGKRIVQHLNLVNFNKYGLASITGVDKTV